MSGSPPRDEPARRPIAALEIEEFGSRLRRLVPELARLVGVDPPGLTARTSRQWHPMDGALPPDCPYSETTRWTPDDSPIELAGDRAWWGPGDLARADERVMLRLPGAGLLSVAGHIPADGSSRDVTELLVIGELPPVIAELLEKTFG